MKRYEILLPTLHAGAQLSVEIQPRFNSLTLLAPRKTEHILRRRNVILFHYSNTV